MLITVYDSNWTQCLQNKLSGRSSAAFVLMNNATIMHLDGLKFTFKVYTDECLEMVAYLATVVCVARQKSINVS